MYISWRRLLGEARCDEIGPQFRRGLCFLFQGQSRRCSGIYLFDAYLRRSTQSHTDVGRWTPVSPDDTEKLISAAVNKCDLDPAPMWLVMKMRRLLSPFMTLLFNKSLITGCFPAAFKQALVRLLLKKPGLDAGDRKSFRPVSNLSLLSKLLKRVAQVRLQAFLDINRLMPTVLTGSITARRRPQLNSSMT